MKDTYDVIVIGSGPGGEGASIKAAKSGKSVAVVERYLDVGGGCTHWGTIPSKTLIHVIQQYSELRSSRLFDKVIRTLKLEYHELMTMVDTVVEQQVRDRQGFYDRNSIDVIHGEARFLDEHTISVREHEGNDRRYTAEAFIIATGSHPYHPEDVDFDNPFVVDSDTILTMKRIPETLTIYGAGVIGSEYASAFRGIGIKVNLVNTRMRMLEFLDDEISDALSYHMRDEKGILIRQNEEYERVEVLDDGVILHLKTGKKIKSDALLWANGRTGNTESLGLETLGLESDQRGNISVNAQYQTTHPHIYAIGDVVGFPALASAAYDQGRFVATHIVEGNCEYNLIKDFPTGIYTNPEISSVGKTERELTADHIPYEVGRSFFRNLARGQITGKTTGMLKLLFHRDSLELLGIHCFGQNASEIVHIGQAIMSQPAPHNNIKYFITTTFNYPTMAEAYRVAALNGYNRLF
ncbi:MAG: Si-specific NAD(P)(+) transhydrogenase [Bacteroidetes bacterium]|nr:Si-specific NAD(P)(+) transhydrogenase [Bacteroidota bacterium]